MGRPAIAMEGRRFGRLVAKEPVKQGTAQMYWRCECDCGAEAVIDGTKLRRGSTKSCGCLRSKLIDLTGQQFSNLLVMTLEGYKGRGKKKGSLWKCRCVCGNEVVVSGPNLRKGNSTSCGCSRLLDRSGEGNRRAVIRSYKNGAMERNLAFELDDSALMALFLGPCHYCGTPPSNVNVYGDAGRPFTYSGIDRIDNAKGYIPGNVVSCCRTCNFAKGSQDYAAFVLWVCAVADHLRGTVAASRGDFQGV